MNVIGIVAEYNPFHNGHLYQINKVKELYPDSIIVVALSGYFTERGEISVMSKWDKARVAIKSGADVVLEIPSIYSIQSADIFSYAAISILNTFHVDTLVFGSESEDADLIYNTAKIQIDNPDFDNLVKSYIDKGDNYPTSLSKAITDLTGNTVRNSNDILAVSYVKEILKNDYKIDILPIKRTNDYLDVNLDDYVVSASNIRVRLKNKENISKYVPSLTIPYIRNIDYDKFFLLLRYKIISEKDSLCKYHLVDEGLENRIYEASLHAKDLDDLVERIKSKRYTYNKINRILINIFLGFTKEICSNYKNLSYIRLLGLSKNGQEFYSSFKKDINSLVITKFERNDMLEIELKVAALYSIIVSDQDIFLDEVRMHTIVS